MVPKMHTSASARSCRQKSSAPDLFSHSALDALEGQEVLGSHHHILTANVQLIGVGHVPAQNRMRKSVKAPSHAFAICQCFKIAQEKEMQ